MIPAEVQHLLDTTNPTTRATALAAHHILTELGCNSYVKTIYIGYDINGDMTAAAYPHADHLEIALAVSDNHPHPQLEDASHLTWRTLPLSIKLATPDDVTTHQALLEEACARVREQHHDVHRDNDYFIGRKQRRRTRPDTA